MSVNQRRTTVIRAELLEQHRRVLGWTNEKLAHHAQINVKTLKRILNGKPTYWATVRRIADVLHINPEELVSGRQDYATIFGGYIDLRIKILGKVTSSEQLLSINRLTQEIATRLKDTGVEVSMYETQCSVVTDTANAPVIVQMDGVRINGPASGPRGPNPFWSYVVVDGDKLSAFISDVNDNAFSIRRFQTQYGFPLCSGFGRKVPADIRSMFAQGLTRKTPFKT